MSGVGGQDQKYDEMLRPQDTESAEEQKEEGGDLRMYSNFCDIQQFE